MENNPQPQSTKQDQHFHEDEIDLRKLFEAIGNFFVNTWFWVIGLIIGFRSITLNYKYLLLFAVIASGVWAYWNTRSEDPFYEGSVIVQSRYFNLEVANDMVNRLNQMDSIDLAEAMEISREAAHAIRDFSVEPILSEDQRIEIEQIKEFMTRAKFDPNYQSVIEKRFNESIQSYEFLISTFDPSILKEVTQALGKYPWKYDFIKKRIAIDFVNLEKKKQKLLSESAKMDSLKNIIYKNLEARNKETREGSNNIILADGTVVNPLSIFSEDMKLYDQILAIERSLELKESILSFEGSHQMTTPASPNFIDNMLYALGFALIAAYALIFLIEINKYLNRVEKRTKEEVSTA